MPRETQNLKPIILVLPIVTVGKWLGTDGELVSFENYNWKVHFLSVTGKVIYTQ